MFKLVLLLLFAALICGVRSINHGQAAIDWANYLSMFPEKTYESDAALNNARYYYFYNRNTITQHNALASRTNSSYLVAENQFSDQRLMHFAASLPKAVYPATSNEAETVKLNPAPEEFDPRQLGLTINATDQGVVCSSSWAYAVAKSVELMNAVQVGNPAPAALSAQALIDCAGSGTGCSTQVPQTAFDYLTQHKHTELLLESEYSNNKSLASQAMCLPVEDTVGIQLISYGRLKDGDDAQLMNLVGNSIPVIVEYNPATFGFMHYSSGIYAPPAGIIRTASSQFLLVLGYGHDAVANLDYWLCLNSFGTTWGENGFIRILRSPLQPITKNAIFPNQLA